MATPKCQLNCNAVAYSRIDIPDQCHQQRPGQPLWSSANIPSVMISPIRRRGQVSAGAPTWRVEAEKHLRWAVLSIERAANMMKRIGGPEEEWMDGAAEMKKRFELG